MIKLKLNFKYNPWLFLVDFAVRCGLTVSYMVYDYNPWIFIAAQIILIGFIAMADERYTKKIQAKYAAAVRDSIRDPEIDLDQIVPDTLVAVQMIIGFGFSFWFVHHAIDNHAWYMYLLFIVLSCVGTLLFMVPIMGTVRANESHGLLGYTVEKLVSNTEKGIKEYVDVTKEHPNLFRNNDDTVELEPVDYNDIQIARFESELKNINYRVEAYMLESVFLGGLAFSGFLTVAAANFLGRETQVFREFIKNVAGFASKCLTESATQWFSEIKNFFHRHEFYILIMLLCLITSVFFLLVLTLRLRITSLSLNIDHLIRVMTVFNAKEEELYNLHDQTTPTPQQRKRLTAIQKKIAMALSDAGKLLGEVKPTVIMMSLYRNVAVFLFYFVLIVSGFYFIPAVATIIFLLAVFTQVFRMLETYSKSGKIQNLLKKHR